MRRVLIVSGVIIAGLVGMYGAGVAMFICSLTRADPFPTFMTDYQLGRLRPISYQEAGRLFSEFIAKTFPIGGDAKGVIAQLTAAGFRVTISSSAAVELLWKRHTGPCSEWYSIVVNQSTDGTIAGITGRLRPICL